MTWEERITLFAGYLIGHNRRSTTVRSYISAIKAMLYQIGIEVQEDMCLLNSLTRACKLTKDKIYIRLPIRKDVLFILIKMTQQHFFNIGQEYLATLYPAIFSTAYFGMFRISEIAEGPHSVKACDVHMGMNKNKILFVLRLSKTHNKGDMLQMIKISSSAKVSSSQEQRYPTSEKIYCSFGLLHNYLSSRRGFRNENENFFVYADRLPVSPMNFRKTMKS